MIKLKRETDYAVQLIQFLLQKKGKNVSLREFSKKSGISFWFLQKIARKLNLAGVINAEQGVNGGYKLGIPEKKLNLYTVVEIMEGCPAVAPCVHANNRFCGETKKCGFKNIAIRLNKDIVKALQSVKISV